MRIALISNMFPSKKDKAFGVFVYNFYQKLQEQGGKFNTKIVIRGKGKNKLEKFLKYIAFYSKGVFLPFLKYDIAYFHFASFCAPLIIWTSILSSKKIVLNIHGSDIMQTKNWFVIFLIKNAIKRTDLVVAPSLYFKEEILKIFGNITPNIYIYPSGGIELDLFTKPFEKRVEDNEKFIIGFVARIMDEKGWQILFNSIEALSSKIPNIQCVFIGKGRNVDKLKEKMKNSKISDKFLYHGFIPQELLPEYYKSFDVFCFPTLLSESLGLVGIEAMACDTPVIGSRIGGLQTYIKDGENGFLFKPGDVNDLSEKILKYYSLSESEKAIMSKNAKATAVKYDAVNVAKELFQSLQSIMQD